MNYPAQFISHHPKTASRFILDEMVILDQEQNMIMTLNETGGDIWSACEQASSIDDITKELLLTYDVDETILRSEIEAFVDQMIADGWLIKSESPSVEFINPGYAEKRRGLSIENDPQYVASQDAEDRIKEKCLSKTHIYAATLELTFRCNEKCRHCYVVKEQNELSTDEWKNVMDQLADMGTLRLVMTGGEPLLRSDFIELLTYAREHRFAVDIFSNGQLFSNEVARAISERYPRTVQFSLYAMSPAIHDSITQVKGSHARTMKAITYCQDHNIPVAVKMPIMTENFDDYPLVKQFAKENGLGYQFNIAISPMNDGREDPLSLRITDEAKIHQYVTDEEISSGNPSDFFSAGSSVDPNNLVPCGAGHNSISVSPSGEIYGCNQLLIPFGNIRDQSIDEIWSDSESLKNLRSISMDQLQPCFTCSDLQYCNRCPGLALVEGGDVRGLSPYDCLIAKVRRNANLFSRKEDVV